MQSQGEDHSLFPIALPTMTGMATIPRPVVDQTGLVGLYDFTLHWNGSSDPEIGDTAAPSAKPSRVSSALSSSAHPRAAARRWSVPHEQQTRAEGAFLFAMNLKYWVEAALRKSSQGLAGEQHVDRRPGQYSNRSEPP
jgi:hypothetical protein